MPGGPVTVTGTDAPAFTTSPGTEIWIVCACAAGAAERTRAMPIPIVSPNSLKALTDNFIRGFSIYRDDRRTRLEASVGQVAPPSVTNL
jgi:hypothetical protein